MGLRPFPWLPPPLGPRSQTTNKAHKESTESKLSKHNNKKGSVQVNNETEVSVQGGKADHHYTREGGSTAPSDGAPPSQDAQSLPDSQSEGWCDDDAAGNGEPEGVESRDNKNWVLG